MNGCEAQDYVEALNLAWNTFGWPMVVGLGVFAIVYKHGWPWRKKQ